MLMEGQSQESFAPRKKGVLGEEMGERYITIGNPTKPHWIGKAEDAKKFFDYPFDFVFGCWRRFKSGFGLPFGGPWTSEHPDLVDAILSFQESWEAYYRDKSTISRLDALIQRG